MWTPIVFGAYADSTVALKRVQELLESSELDFEPIVDKESDHAVIISNGNFKWDTDYTTTSTSIHSGTKRRGSIHETIDAMASSSIVNSSAQELLSIPLNEFDSTFLDSGNHPKHKNRTLRNISFSIPRGKLVAIGLLDPIIIEQKTKM